MALNSPATVRTAHHSMPTIMQRPSSSRAVLRVLLELALTSTLAGELADTPGEGSSATSNLWAGDPPRIDLLFTETPPGLFWLATCRGEARVVHVLGGLL